MDQQLGTTQIETDVNNVAYYSFPDARDVTVLAMTHAQMVNISCGFKPESIASDREEKARNLLYEFLTEEEKAEYKEKRSVTVKSKKFDGWSYVIGGYDGANIFIKDETGKYLALLCATPGDSFPNEDRVLAQILWLKHDEEGFLRDANKFGVSPTDLFTRFYRRRALNNHEDNTG